MGPAYLVRYADDFVCCFQHEYEAKKCYSLLVERLEKFGLNLSKDKTQIIEFGLFAKRGCRKKGKNKPGTFDFLGFTHYCGTK